MKHGSIRQKVTLRYFELYSILDIDLPYNELNTKKI